VDDVRLSPDTRGAFRKLVKKGLAIKDIAYYFETTRQTVYRWLKRGKHKVTAMRHECNVGKLT
jgi:DNA invertase Pin-like site-specific DNA recombinase